MMKFLLIIGAGGFCGAISRYYLSIIFSRRTILSIPSATLFINVLGSLAAGFLYGANHFTSEQQSFLTIGFLASFTTFSTFNYELLQLFNNNKHFRFFLYGTMMYLTSILAACCGYLWGK